MPREFKTTIRLTGTERDLIEREAEHAGLTPAEFTRFAALALAIYQRGTRGEDPGRTMLDIIERLRRR